jgi:hypothetical protein
MSVVNAAIWFTGGLLRRHRAPSVQRLCAGLPGGIPSIGPAGHKLLVLEALRRQARLRTAQSGRPTLAHNGGLREQRSDPGGVE